MMDEKAKIYSFGEFQLVLEERTLLRGGESVALQPKCFDTLAYLVENSGRVLEKDELIKTLWPDSFVEEGNLAQNIFVLRQVLGDDRNGHSFIKTIPRRGYKFVAPVALAEPASGNGVPVAYWGQHSPFRSLRAFEAEDSWLFFGREAEIGELLECLGRSPVLVVAGNSGCGKSSVLRAGLVSALNEGEGQEAAWRIAVFRPSANPFDYLAEVLPGLLAPELSAKEQAELIADCRKRFPADENALRDAVSALAGANRTEAGQTRVLLVADQFEETFTLTASKETRDRYIDLLLAAARPHGPVPVHLVLALRADFYANCLELAAAQAEPGLIDALLEDAGEEPGNLALLEHALGQLWSKCGGFGRRLTNSAYAEIGRLRGALGRHADEVYHGLRDEGQKRLAQRIFLELVTVGENAGVQDTRRTVRKKDLLALNGTPEETEQLLAMLASSRLISTSGEGEDAFAEVSHEALIREWPLLREWIAQNREELRLERRLLQSAEEWQALHCDSGALLQGARLAQAEEWLAGQVNASALVGEFVQVSVIAREAAEQKKLAARKREGVRLRWFASSLAVLFLIAAGAAVFTYHLQKLERSRAMAAQAQEMLGRDQGQAFNVAIHAWQTAKTEEARLAVLKAFPQSLARLTHSDAIASIAFSPDGKRIVTGGYDHLVKVWSGVDGHLLVSLTGHTEEVLKGCFSPDGRLIATASSDHTARIWDSQSGSLIRVLRGHDDAVTGAIFSADGQQIVTASNDHTARVWSTADGRLLFNLNGHSADIGNAVFSPDRQKILTTSYDHTAKIWNSSNGRLIASLNGHTGEIIYGEFSADGQRIVTCSWDHTARIWSSVDGHLLATLQHDGRVTSAVFSPDGERVASGSLDHTARIWNGRDGRQLAILKGKQSGIMQVRFSSDGRYIITSSEDSTNWLWNSWNGRALAVMESSERERRYSTMTQHGHQRSFLIDSVFSHNGERIAAITGGQSAQLWNTTASGQSLFILQGHTGEIMSAEFSPDSQLIATASVDSTARVWSSANGSLVTVLQGHANGLGSANFSANGRYISTASADKTARIWETSTWHLLCVLRGHTDQVWRAVFSPVAERIVTAGGDSTARIWRRSDGELLTTLKGGGIWRASFSPDGKVIVTTGRDNTARLWNSADGQLLATLEGSSPPLWVAEFSPDSQRIVTAGSDGTAQVWRTADHRLLMTLRGHSGLIGQAAFSADGQRIVTTSADHTCRVWNSSDGQLVAILEGHTDRFHGVQFSPDGQRIVTASLDHTARVWDSATGRLLAILPGHTDRVFDVRFSPDGHKILTGSWDRTARVWRVLTLDDIEKMLYQ